jgi:hypothetical protein
VARGPSVLAASVNGAVALLGGPFTSAAGLLLFRCAEGEAGKESHFPASPDARPLALRASASWTACAFRTEDGVDVRLFSSTRLDTRAQLHLAGAATASIRFAADQHLTIADDRGRVLVMELEHGALVHDARL